MKELTKLFKDNEKQANKYTELCLLYGVILVILIWIFNSLDFFTVNKRIMNIVMPIAIVFMIVPYIIQKTKDIESTKWKYLMMTSFVIGIFALSSAMSMHTILAWACPIILSCHYYTPKFTKFTLGLTFFAMFFSIYICIYIGVWDSNIMGSNNSVYSLAERLEFIKQAKLNGDNILVRTFNFYYLPRALILLIVCIVCNTLSNRTHNLVLNHSLIMLEKERIGAELDVATNIQASMLPRIFPAFPEQKEFDIYATMTPAKEVGGDFYDFFLIDKDHLAIVIADVSGKGVPAALFMVISKTLIKNFAKPGATPGQVLQQVNIQLCEGNDAGMFVTVWLGIYEISTRKLTASNAGHEYPALKRANGQYEIFKDKHGFVLAGMEMSKYKDYEIQLEVGDELYIYTDGVAEATNTANELYGTERMLNALNESEYSDMKELLANIKTDIDIFAGSAPQFDDITMVVFKVKN